MSKKVRNRFRFEVDAVEMVGKQARSLGVLSDGTPVLGFSKQDGVFVAQRGAGTWDVVQVHDQPARGVRAAVGGDGVHLVFGVGNALMHAVPTDGGWEVAEVAQVGRSSTWQIMVDENGEVGLARVGMQRLYAKLPGLEWCETPVRVGEHAAVGFGPGTVHFAYEAERSLHHRVF